MINYLKKIGINSKKAFENLSSLDIKKRNKILETYSKKLRKNQKKIIKENLKDIKNCKQQDLIDRLELNSDKIEGIRNSLKEIRNFSNPLNKIISKWKRPMD